MRVPRSPDGLPTPVRAALGLAATVLDEAKQLPNRAIELPMQAMSRAMQLSMQAQQHYAALTARGDEVLAARQVTDEPPEWATFDAPVDDLPDNGVSDDDAPDDQLGKVPNAPRHSAPSAFDVVDDQGPTDEPSAEESPADDAEPATE